MAGPMTNPSTNDLARELLKARDSLQGIDMPLSARDADFSMDDAYQVEAEIMRQRQQAGHKPNGRKVGYANKAMWRILKLDTLVWAHMYEDTVRIEHGNVGQLEMSEMYQGRLEPEIVFKLREAPAAGLDAEGVLAAVEWVALGFEVIDCPFPNWEFQPVDFVAAYGLHRALIVGEPKPVEAGLIPGLAEQLQKFTLRLFSAGGHTEDGAGKNSLRSPAACLAELATAAANRNQPLEAGELISTGTLSKAPDLEAGQAWTVTLDGLELPDLSLRVVE